MEGGSPDRLQCAVKADVRPAIDRVVAAVAALVAHAQAARGNYGRCANRKPLNNLGEGDEV